MSRTILPAYLKVVVVGAGLMLIIVAVVLAGYFAMRGIYGASLKITQQNFPALASGLQIDRDLYQAQLALERVVRATDPIEIDANIAEFAENMGQIDDMLAGLVADESSLELQRLLEAHDQEQRAWRQTAAELVEAKGQPRFEAAAAQHLRLAGGQFFTMRTAFDRVVDEVLQPRISVSNEQLNDQVRKAQLTLGIALAVALFLASWLAFAGVATIRTQHVALIAEKEVRDRESQRKEFEQRVRRAMELSGNEAEALDVVSGAVDEVLKDTFETELLLADASMAHLRRVAVSESASNESGCKVAKPHDCPAIRRNATMKFGCGTTFEACPYHKSRGAANDRSAVCVPVSIMGRSMGVLHALGPVGELPDAEQMNALAAVVGAAGDEIGLLRAFATKDRQANTDPLTGLLNRRSLELQVTSVISQSGNEYSVVFADLDNFKKLNDTHGHDAGDRALRLFADALRGTLRPSDLACRWGGEEFVLVLPGTSGQAVVNVIGRIEEDLYDRLSSGAVPGFTVSFGVGDSQHYSSFNAVVNAADDALLQAKREGRNCIVYPGFTAKKIELDAGGEQAEDIATQDAA
jgi:diguanylate cyclase (GGDEF)-like protein